MKISDKIKHNMVNDRVWLLGGVSTMAILILVTVVSLSIFRYRVREVAGILEGADSGTRDAYYVMITADDSSAFWKSVYESAREACEENNIALSFMSDGLEKSYSPGELLEIAIASKVDGIILQADESDKMWELINRASYEKIPVVTVMGDNSGASRKSFVQVGSFNVGREYGKQVLKSLTGEEKKVLVLMDGATIDSSQNLIYSGLQETIEAEVGKEMKLQFEAMAIDGNDAFAAEESIREIFMSPETPDVMITLSELSTTCAYQAMIDYNKVGQISLFGFHDSQIILKGIDQGVISATISVDTNEMGRYCVEALNEYRQTGYVSEYYSVDIQMITADNVDEYMNKDEEQYIGGGQDEHL